MLHINLRFMSVKICIFSQPELTGTASCIHELLRVSSNETDLLGFKYFLNDVKTYPLIQLTHLLAMQPNVFLSLSFLFYIQL